MSSRKVYSLFIDKSRSVSYASRSSETRWTAQIKCCASGYGSKLHIHCTFLVMQGHLGSRRGKFKDPKIYKTSAIDPYSYFAP